MELRINFCGAKIMNTKILKGFFTGSVLFALVLFQGLAFLPTKALAAYPAFNNDPKDLEMLTMKNRTQGSASWQDPVAANAGDKIAFAVYYHNTVPGTTAQNTKIRLDFEDNKNNQLKFHAFLWADNANYVQDLGTVTVPCSGLAFTFEKTVLWYPNQGTTPQNLSVTAVQSNSMLVNIGNIAGGWSSQGYVVFEGTVLRFTPKFNFMAEDRETLTLKNRTKGTANWQDPISADGGDTIAFAVYYHNGIVCSIARNTRISIEFPKDAGNKIVTAGIIEADNAAPVSDYGTINVSGSNEKLTFKTTALWYPNQSTQGQVLPVTISGNRATVNIADIEGCWPYQGYVVFEADLSLTPSPTPTPKPPIPRPTVTPTGSVLAAYSEKQVAGVPVTGASSVIVLSALSSILGYGAVARKKIKEKLLNSKLQKVVGITRKKKGL
jgi:hypothetical protein